MEINNNNNNNNNPTPSLWEQETQQAPSRTWKGVHPRFQGISFLSSLPHFFVFSPGSEKRAGQDATWTL